MSIAQDFRTYADTAIAQGLQVLQQSRSTAAAQLGDVSDQANEFYAKTRANVSDVTAKANSAVEDLRAAVEKAINLDALKSAAEPHLARANDYAHAAEERASGLIAGVTSDKRVSKLVGTANVVSDVVVGTVRQRVVEPVFSLTGRGSATTAKTRPVAKTTPVTTVTDTPTTTAAATKPTAPKPSPAKAAASKPATKPATTKPATKPAAKPAARKAPTQGPAS